MGQMLYTGVKKFINLMYGICELRTSKNPESFASPMLSPSAGRIFACFSFIYNKLMKFTQTDPVVHF